MKDHKIIRHIENITVIPIIMSFLLLVSLTFFILYTSFNTRTEERLEYSVYDVKRNLVALMEAYKGNKGPRYYKERNEIIKKTPCTRLYKKGFTIITDENFNIISSQENLRSVFLFETGFSNFDLPSQSLKVFDAHIENVHVKAMYEKISDMYIFAFVDAHEALVMKYLTFIELASVELITFLLLLYISRALLKTCILENLDYLTDNDLVIQGLTQELNTMEGRVRDLKGKAPDYDKSLIDLKDAVTTSGSYDVFLEKARDFRRVIKENASYLENALLRKNWRAYTNIIEEIIDGASFVGALTLKKQAQYLAKCAQVAADDNNINKKKAETALEERTHLMLDLYRKYYDALDVF